MTACGAEVCTPGRPDVTTSSHTHGEDSTLGWRVVAARYLDQLRGTGNAETVWKCGVLRGWGEFVLTWHG